MSCLSFFSEKSKCFPRFLSRKTNLYSLLYCPYNFLANKTTVQKMLQTLFLQHFNGFILHRTFVVYHESCCIIFLKTSFSLRRNGVFLLFCCYRQPHRLKLPGYTAESSSSDKCFLVFSTKSEQIVTQQSHTL